MPVSLSKQLASLTDSTERAILKAQAHEQLLSSLKTRERSFRLKDGRTVTIEQVGFGVFDGKSFTQPEGKIPAIWVHLNVDGKYLNGDGWYGFVNPPIMVPDGTKREVLDSITGETRLVDNFKEDLRAAAMAIIAQAVGGEV